jgi:hypothetical protein
MIKKMVSVFLLISLSSILLLGCTDYEAIQKSVVQAFAKEKEIKSYSFDGTAALKVDGSLAKTSNPLAAGLLGMLQQGEISWKGAANNEPAQMESTIKLTPAGGTASIEIPVLIKDNKMYFHIPALSAANEFYSIDLKAGSAAAAGNLQQAAGSLTEAVGLIVGSANAKWFNESKDPVNLADGTNGKKISINITDKNVKDFNALLQSKMPELADKLQAGGLIDANKAEAWKKAGGGQKVTVKAPGQIEFVIDEQGFIREQSCDLTITFAGENGAAEATNSIKLHQAYNNINQPPAFGMQVPSDAKPFEDVLKFLNPKK